MDDLKEKTVKALTADYLACCEMTEADAIKNSEHLYDYVLAVDDTNVIRRKETMMPFFWLEHTVTDPVKFKEYREHLRTNDGEPPEWAEDGFGCSIALLPFLNKGEETENVFYLAILLQPTEFSDQNGQAALAQTQVIDWEDKSGTVS